MDITGWTLEQRMRLPDWLFGTREVVSVHIKNEVAGSLKWGISNLALKDPAVIWSFGLIVIANDHKWNWIRMGLADVVPTNEAEMNASQNFLPGFGNPGSTPPTINTSLMSALMYHVPLMKGIATSERKLVAEARVHVAGTILQVIVYVVVSGLPTDMAGWLAHSLV